MWHDPGTWIALGVSVLFVVVGLVMHRVFLKILKSGPIGEPPHHPPGKPPAASPPTPLEPHE